MEAISAELKRSGREISVASATALTTGMRQLTVLEINIRTEVHRSGHSLENQSPLSPGRHWEFNLPVQSSRSK